MTLMSENARSLRSLMRHPDSPCDAVAAIDVDVMRGPENALSLRYVVMGDMSALRLPPTTVSARKDGLWEHTCLEAIVRPKDDASYFEFNFSPSTEWSAYCFEDYRNGMRPAGDIAPPQIHVDHDRGRLELRVSLALPFPAGNVAWELAVATVIEEMSGRRSWWALAHPPGKPDFHHRDGFVLRLAEPLSRSS